MTPHPPSRPARRRWPCHAALATLLSLAAAAPLWPASFPGNARVDVTDSTGALSWVPANNALTVMCWFKIVVPSGTTITENMTILVSRKDGDENSTYAYLIRYNVSNGNVEFVTKRSDGSAYTRTLIAGPYLDRWYHVAVVRSGSSITPYIDGQAAAPEGTGVGDTSATSGVSIAGWGSAKYFYGEVQEVAIIQYALSGSTIRDMMFRDIPTGQAPFAASLKGYYKLGYTTNSADRYRNFAASPPSGTDPGAAAGTGAGQIAFEETDREGEQSTFDSRKNKGADALVPVSGGFTWEQQAFSRPTPGTAFELRLLYSSSLANVGPEPNGVDPYDAKVFGPGWRHNFETRIIPEQTTTQRRLLMWNGGIETWVKTNNVYKTRHKEYRGDLNTLASGDMEWVSPDRLAYRFYDPTDQVSEGLRGRLYEIRDPNSNIVQIAWDEFSGRVSQVTDTVGGVYTFNYSAQNLLTNVTFGQWAVNFEYDATNRLSAKSFTGPSQYTSVNTRWAFAYSNNFLRAVTDPRNSTTSIYYDRYGRVVEERDPLDRAKKTEYNIPAVRQITRTDPVNQKWIETYDRKGRLTAQTDPLGNRATTEYDGAGNAIRTVQPMGNTTTYGYDARSNKTGETNALGLITTWTYHPWYNKPVTETNPEGWVQHWDYDAAGNITRQYDDIGTMVEYTYLPSGLVDTAKDGNANTTTFAYTADGFLRTKTDPLGNTWTYTRNDIGWLLTAKNPLNETATMYYDINGNVVRTVDALSRTYLSVYDARGNLTSQSDAKGQVTQHFYDAAGQRTRTVDRAGAEWRTTFNSRGQPEKAIDPYSNNTTNTYDSAARLIRVTDPLGNAIQSEYDANNNLTATIDKLGQRAQTRFDHLNRVVARIDPLGNTVSYTFDAVGRIKTITSPNGYPQTHEYDGRGRLTRWVDAEGYPWRYVYDGNANILKIIDALGGEYVMTYGPRNERLTELNQDGKLWVYTYDVLGRLKTQNDPNDITRTVTYDPGGRAESVAFSTGRINSLVYDDNDLPEVATRLGSGPTTTTTRLRFDAMDRVIECRDHFNKTLNFTYDLMGRRQTLRYPDGKVLSYGYDKLSRVTGMTNWASETMAFTYDKADRLTSKTYPNGITQTNAFDSAGRLTALEYRPSGGNPTIALTYAYDKNGNKTGSSEQGTLAWSNPSKIDQRAQYTPAGRLIDKVDVVDPARNYTYHYDPNGNMTNAVGVGESFGLTYDEDNRVTALHWDNPLADKDIVNRLDVVGRRIGRTVGAIETRYVLDLSPKMETILCDTDGTGNITAWYVHGPGGLAYKLDASGNMTCYHADAQGNVIALTDRSRNTAAQYGYSPYGRMMPGSTDDGNPYRFVGSLGVMEEIPNLYFMRARYYSGDVGVFLSTDPVKKIGPGSRQENYMYVLDNPLRFFDPEGTTTLSLGGSIGGGVAVGLGLEQTFGAGFVFDSDAFVEGDFGNAFGFYLSESSTLKGGAVIEFGPSVQLDIGWSNKGYGVKSMQSSGWSEPDRSVGGSVTLGASVGYSGTANSGELSIGGGLGAGFYGSGSTGYTKAFSLNDFVKTTKGAGGGPPPTTQALSSKAPVAASVAEGAKQKADQPTAPSSGGSGLSPQLAAQTASTLSQITPTMLSSATRSQLSQLSSALSKLSAALSALQRSSSNTQTQRRR